MPLRVPNTAPASVPGSPRARIGIARDAAFCFYYRDNLALLEDAGAELVYWSPLRDSVLPTVDGLYFGGGYPELYGATLAANGLAEIESLEARKTPAIQRLDRLAGNASTAGNTTWAAMIPGRLLSMRGR